jgi:hypothetical protein
MSRHELNLLEQQLFDDTVLADFINPLIESFERIRYNPQIYGTLPMQLFATLGCLRHLQGSIALREFVQTLFHLTEEEKLPLPRSTAADALASKRRQNDLEAALDQLYKKACASLPDRLKDIPGLQGR